MHDQLQEIKGNYESQMVQFQELLQSNNNNQQQFNEGETRSSSLDAEEEMLIKAIKENPELL